MKRRCLRGNGHIPRTSRLLQLSDAATSRMVERLGLAAIRAGGLRTMRTTLLRRGYRSEARG